MKWIVSKWSIDERITSGELNLVIMLAAFLAMLLTEVPYPYTWAFLSELLAILAIVLALATTFVALRIRNWLILAMSLILVLTTTNQLLIVINR